MAGRPRNRGNNGHLKPEERRIVVSGCIESLTNRQIREKLNDAGYPSTISNQSIWKIRKSQEVQDELQAVKFSVMSTGYCNRVQRIVACEQVIRLIMRRISLDEAAVDAVMQQIAEYKVDNNGKLPDLRGHDLSNKFLDTRDLSRLVTMLHRMLDLIAKLVDGDYKLRANEDRQLMFKEEAKTTDTQRLSSDDLAKMVATLIAHSMNEYARELAEARESGGSEDASTSIM